MKMSLVLDQRARRDIFNYLFHLTYQKNEINFNAAEQRKVEHLKFVLVFLLIIDNYLHHQQRKSQFKVSTVRTTE